MSKLIQLINECRDRNLNCSVVFQSINMCSVEIYKGYKDTYQLIYYTDGHLTIKKAIKKGLNYIKEEYMPTFNIGLKEGGFYAINTRNYYGFGSIGNYCCAFKYNLSRVKEGKKVAIQGYSLSAIENKWLEEIIVFDPDLELKELSKQDFEELISYEPFK